jgi:hypothetical protein
MDNALTCKGNESDDNTDIHSIDSFTFEDFYIDAYISTGKKTESYMKAIQATGYDEPNNPRQSAWSFHQRMERDGLIEKALLNATLMDRIQSRLKLNQLRDEAESEAVQLQAAKITAGSLYTNESAAQGVEITINRDNVQITHKNQTLTVEDK